MKRTGARVVGAIAAMVGAVMVAAALALWLLGVL